MSPRQAKKVACEHIVKAEVRLFMDADQDDAAYRARRLLSEALQELERSDPSLVRHAEDGVST